MTTPGFQKVLLVGLGGNGKTTQSLTLAGPQIYYALDTNAFGSLSVADKPDRDIIQIDPDMTAMDLDTWNISSGSANAPVKKEPKLYDNWRKDFEERVHDGVFEKLGEQGGWLILDGLTLLSYELMLLGTYRQRRLGMSDGRMDHQLGGQKMCQVMYWVARQPCNVLCTARYVVRQDDKTRQIVTELDLPGKARQVGTYSFDWVLGCQVESQGEDKPAKFWLRTVQDEDHPALRVVAGRMPGKKLPSALVDGTLDFTKPLEGQGIGAWLNPEEGK